MAELKIKLSRLRQDLTKSLKLIFNVTNVSFCPKSEQLDFGEIKEGVDELQFVSLTNVPAAILFAGDFPKKSTLQCGFLFVLAPSQWSGCQKLLLFSELCTKGATLFF